MTWSDDQGVDHIVRLDVPGNEALEAEFQAGRPRRSTPDELQRSIEWTDQHSEWRQQVDAELEDIAASRYQEGDTGTPERPLSTPPEVSRGPRSYFDSHTGAIVQADSAASLGGQSRDYWRLVHTDDEVQGALAEGEPAITVPPDFTILDPGRQIDVARRAIDRLYGEPTKDDPGGPFHRQILDLQQQWGISRPVQGYRPLTPEELPALPSILPGSLERSEVEAGGVVPVQYQGHAPRVPRTSPSPQQPFTSFIAVDGRARDLAHIDGLDWEGLSPIDQDRYWARALAEWRSGHGRAIRLRPPRATLPQSELGSAPPPIAPPPSAPPAPRQPSELRPGRLLDPGIFHVPKRRLDMWPVPEDRVPPSSDLDPDITFPTTPRSPTPWPPLTLGAPTDLSGLRLAAGGTPGLPPMWMRLWPHREPMTYPHPDPTIRDRSILRFPTAPDDPSFRITPRIMPGQEVPMPKFPPQTPPFSDWPDSTRISPSEAPVFPNPPAGEMGLQADPGIVDRLWRRFTGIDPSSGMSLGMIPVTPGALGTYGSGSLIGRSGVPSLSLSALRSARNQLWRSGAKGAGQGGFEPSVPLAQPLSRLTPFRPLIGLGTSHDADVVALYRQYLQSGQQGALAERLALPGGEEEFQQLMRTLSGVR